MTELTERQRVRFAAQELFDSIAVDYVGSPGVGRARMFGSEGLRSHGKFFAFVDGDGGLIVKLPAEMASGLVADGEATPVRIGRNPAREWVTLPTVSADNLQPWRDALDHAYRYVTEAAGQR